MHIVDWLIAFMVMETPRPSAESCHAPSGTRSPASAGPSSR